MILKVTIFQSANCCSYTNHHNLQSMPFCCPTDITIRAHLGTSWV